MNKRPTTPKHPISPGFTRDEVWYTPSPKALKVQAETAQKAEGLQSISIEWNKQADPQTWLGLGFGWNGWTGKNFEAITQQAALSFWVKSKEGQSAGLPWAVGFEDLSFIFRK